MRSRFLLWFLILVGALAVRPALAAPSPKPTSGEIAYSYNGNIWLLDLATGQPRQLTTDGQNATPAWSPDGRWLTFVSRANGNADLYRIRPDGSARTRLTTDPHDDIQPAYAPDGTLFFVRVLQAWTWPQTEEEAANGPFDDGHSVIMKYRAGGAETVVYDLGTGALDPPHTLSARSATRLAVSRTGHLYVDIVLIDLAAPRSRSFNEVSLNGLFEPWIAAGFCAQDMVPDQAFSGQWAPSGGVIAFTGAADCADPGIQGNHDGIYAWAADQPNAAPTLLNADEACCLGVPTWSPDARWIVFEGWRPNGNDRLPNGLWVIPAQGGTAQQISPTGAEPAWRPTGGALPGMPATGRETAWLPLALLGSAGTLLLIGVAVRRRQPGPRRSLPQ